QTGMEIYTALPINWGYNFHLSGDKIYFLFRHGFYEVDLTKRKVIARKDFRKDVLGDLRDLPDPIFESKYKAWNVWHTTMYEDYIYFTGKKDERNAKFATPEYLGAFNVKTMTVDWEYKLEDENHTFKFNPVFEADRLYILDTANRLHVFQRES
ncbi:MAG: hypothetical protein SFU99_22685, partial [Saprospiraceae bacterium]|nr:hypothetical protein [Saprospiraceae bacterium]